MNLPTGPVIEINNEKQRVVAVKVGTTDEECEFHSKHRDMPVYDLYTLTIREKRAVCDNSSRWAGNEPTLNLDGPWGYRAQDSLGDWWTADWDYADYTDFFRKEFWVRVKDKIGSRIKDDYLGAHKVRNTY